MTQTFLPKLVRDKIPQIIQASGKTCEWHHADTSEYVSRLHDKMQEELAEFKEDPCVEEAADMFEVFLALLRNWEIDISDVALRAQDKKISRGGFKNKIVLESIE